MIVNNLPNMVEINEDHLWQSHEAQMQARLGLGLQLLTSMCEALCSIPSTRKKSSKTKHVIEEDVNVCMYVCMYVYVCV
jgi:hypothetical protein